MHKANTGRAKSIETRNKIRVANTGKKHSAVVRQRMKESAVNRKSSKWSWTPERKTAHSLACKGRTGKYEKNSEHEARRKRLAAEASRRPDVRRKKRIAAIEYAEKVRGIRFPNLGRNERHLLDVQEIKDHCVILRQHRIHDLGYIVDGYCPETNTVYEVYEKQHDHRKRQDEIRQQDIQQFLKCAFIIIQDSNE